jgi:chromosome segregation ATPase
MSDNINAISLFSSSDERRNAKNEEEKEEEELPSTSFQRARDVFQEKKKALFYTSDADIFSPALLRHHREKEDDESNNSAHYSARVKSLEAILRALGERNARLSEKNEELKEACSEYKLNADRIAERFAMASERMSVLEREREEVLERQRELSDAYDAQTSEYRRAERENEGLRRDGERDGRRLRELEGEKRELEQELNGSKIDLETLREKYANARADLTVVQAELDAYRWKLEAADAKIEALVRQRDAFNGLDEDYRHDENDGQNQPPPLIPFSPALVKGTQTLSTKNKSSQNKSTNTNNNNNKIIETSSEHLDAFVLRERNAKLLEENSQLKQALINEEKMKLKALELANEARAAAATAETRCFNLEEELSMYV